jgi:hypothetical protein
MSNVVMQALEERFQFPVSFGRKYRDIVQHCSDYIMEELAACIWYGGAIAALGPQGFLKLWKSVQPALWHYLYNRSATEEEMRQAAHQLRCYACDLEKFVIQGKVTHELLSTTMCA